MTYLERAAAEDQVVMERDQQPESAKSSRQAEPVTGAQ